MFLTTAKVAVVLAVIAGGAGAYPLEAPAAPDEPCRRLRDTAVAWYAEHKIVPKNLSSVEAILFPATPAVPVAPSLAFACLESIPLDRDTALAHVEFLHPLFEWQSTVDYLKGPPRGYLSEGVDLLRGLDDIAAKLRADPPAYANEFGFLAELHVLVSRVRDAHFGYTSLLLDLFTLRPGAEFVSISRDGVALPEIFLHSDIKHDKEGYVPSPVSTIDGLPALEYLERAAVADGGAHDPDARFNALFPSASKEVNYLSSGVDSFVLGLNDTTTVACRNGTVLTLRNTAFLRANLTAIASAADLYREFGRAGGTAPLPTPWYAYKAADRGYVSDFERGGFPRPVRVTVGGDAAGFLPAGPDFPPDVAVLAVNSFAPTIDVRNFSASLGLMGEIHAVTVDFIRQARAAGRSKLILDLQGNSGGQLLHLAVLYFNLFPSATLTFPLQSQLRTHPQLASLLASQKNTTSPLPWLLRIYQHPNGTAWPSAAEFYGPVPGTSHTNPSLFTHDALLSPLFLNYTAPWPTPPFRPADILILTDGECASACAVLTAALTHAHRGIRTLAVGGRPRHAPMQAVGRTRGGPAADFGAFPATAGARLPRGGVPGPEAVPPMRLRVVGRGTWGEGVHFNLADVAPLGEEAGTTPLQFRYEAAHGRLFFTWEMAREGEEVWRVAAGVAWGDGRCVRGSTEGEAGRMGGAAPGYTPEVEDGYRLGPGPGALG
ncbi:hypothetical protein B0H67DRAFT_556972 [Lasiosphaeris hirsuta]|uniref:CPAF-like PDZ domain-containing protein n=1 Tax=Lasiosphaeris hirsuta TaxID=260670 RepID=A0AA40A3A9_9PEZI|nr:hypothetical protein B0H67DRAFT_556972 [Lasiosphaeris hirsuta]